MKPVWPEFAGITGNKFLVGAVSVGVALLLGLGALGLRLASQVGDRPVVGSPAPDFELTLYPEYRAGLPETLRLSDLRGQVVLINFWASWCLECRNEAPDLEATWRQYKDRGVMFIGVDYLDTEKYARDFLNLYGVTYANGVDIQQRIARGYRITGVPETFIVDKRGSVRFIALRRMRAQEISNTIDPLLAE